MLGLMIFVPIIYIAIAWAIVKRLPNKKAKWIVAIVFILIPTWDEIAGRIYFKYLCEAESGVHVYRTVELPPEYWETNGEAKFITKNGLADVALLGDKYDFSSEFQENYSQVFRIKRHAEIVTNKQTNENLGRYVRFIYFGGWVVNHTGAHVSGAGCPAIKDYNYRGFLKQIFTPRSTKK